MNENKSNMNLSNVSSNLSNLSNATINSIATSTAPLSTDGTSSSWQTLTVGESPYHNTYTYTYTPWGIYPGTENTPFDINVSEEVKVAAVNTIKISIKKLKEEATKILEEIIAKEATNSEDEKRSRQLAISFHSGRIQVLEDLLKKIEDIFE